MNSWFIILISCLKYCVFCSKDMISDNLQHLIKIMNVIFVCLLRIKHDFQQTSIILKTFEFLISEYISNSKLISHQN